jgi:hypothetical protein
VGFALLGGRGKLALIHEAVEGEDEGSRGGDIVGLGHVVLAREMVREWTVGEAGKISLLQYVGIPKTLQGFLNGCLAFKSRLLFAGTAISTQP